MQIAFRIVISTLVFGAAAVGALQFDTSWAATAVQCTLTLPQDYLRWQQVKRQDVRVTDSFHDTQARIERKNQIIRAVREQRLSLRSAVKEFLAVSQDCWYEWDYQTEAHPEWSKEKRCAQIIVDSIGLTMPEEEQASAATLQLLETELVAWTDN